MEMLTLKQSNILITTLHVLKDITQSIMVSFELFSDLSGNYVQLDGKSNDETLFMFDHVDRISDRLAEWRSEHEESKGT